MNKELKQQAHKEFDENYKLSFITLYTALAQVNPEHELIGFEDKIKSFLDFLIDRAVQMTEERIIGEVKDMFMCNFQIYKENNNINEIENDILSLITNTKIK